jgi:hypothetical protein
MLPNIHPLIALSFFASVSIVLDATALEQSFARVVYCQNEVGRAEVYLPGSVITAKGRAEVRLGDKTVIGYIAFDFTPVGKNKSMEAVRIHMSDNGSALVVELFERGSRATIPVMGGKVAFPQRLAEEMNCSPLKVN